MSSKEKYSDQELIRMLQGRKRQKEKAFTFIYNNHSQRVYAYCLRITGSAEDANDIFQETFFKFYDLAANSKEIENFNALLLRIARNLCLNYKREKSKVYHPEDFEYDELGTNYEDKELLDLISKSLELLSFKDREAFVLRQYQGLAYSEIAEIIGVTESAAKNRCWRAKEKIKEILEPYLKDIENN